MQKPDLAKRQAIMDAAAQFFAARPYHEVRLDDIVEAAHIGKGTLYVYFKGKDDLYGSLILDGFAQLLARIHDRIEADTDSAWDVLELVVRELVAWGRRFPQFFNLMRSGPEQEPVPGLRQKRRELAKLIEAIINRGIRDGVMCDPRPDLTAQFIPSCVRGALRFGPCDLSQDALANHVMRILRGGICRKKS